MFLAALLVGCKGEVAEEVEAEPPPKPRPVQAAPVESPDPAQSRVATLPRTPESVEALAEAAGRIHASNRRTFYCGCVYTAAERIARGTCGYDTRADESLSKRLTWERIVPVQAYGPGRPCWANEACEGADGKVLSGVACCLETDPVFAAMYMDLHNLVPAIAEVAQDRSGFPFGEVEGEARMYGACDFEVDHSTKVAEPAPAIRGKIARAYLYMHEQYGDALRIDPNELEMFRGWHAADPPDAWDRERNAAITELQGVGNPFVAGTAAPTTGVAAGRLDAMLASESGDGAQ
jgi:deoxyribonuclease I